MKINRLREIIREEISEMLTLGGDTSSSEKSHLDYTKDEINKMSLEDAIKLYKKAKQGWDVPATQKVKKHLIDRIEKLDPKYFSNKKTNKKLSETEAPAKEKEKTTAPPTTKPGTTPKRRGFDKPEPGVQPKPKALKEEEKELAKKIAQRFLKLKK